MDGFVDILKMLAANVISHFVVDWLKKLFKNYK